LLAALLGTTDNGRWLIATKDAPVTINRRYRPGTLILETEFKTDTGCAVIIDFMPPAAAPIWCGSSPVAWAESFPD
jgi:hypothetical protein